MKLLIITQKVDEEDDNLGFFVDWLKEFAKNCKKIIVICLEKGECNLPENIKILSLGKPASRLKYLFNFYKYIWQERKNYDAVFVHMIPEYAVLGGLIWKLLKKKIYLWYVHKTVNLSLKIANWFVDKIFTASPESCRIKSRKIIITGHGINTEKFQNPNSKPQTNSKFRIITAGRITPSKNLDLLVEAAKILERKNFDFQIKIAGAPIFEADKIYFENLKKIGKGIIFLGAIPYKKIADFYREGNLFVNFSDTGSIDKAVLEAMASGLLVLTSNEAFRRILPPKYFAVKNPEEIAEKILKLSQAEADSSLRDYVIRNHSLNQLIIKLIFLMA